MKEAYSLQDPYEDGLLGLHTWDINGAISAGFFNQSSPITIECPTGNCTWPAFSTLGLCTSCTNVTQQVTVSNCTFDFCGDEGCDGPGVKSCAFPSAKQQSQPPDCLSWPKTDGFDAEIHITFSTPDNISFDLDLGGSISPTTLTRAEYDPGILVGGGIVTSATNLLTADDPEVSELDVSNYIFLVASYESWDVDHSIEIGVCPKMQFKTVLDCRARMCLEIFQPASMVLPP